MTAPKAAPAKKAIQEIMAGRCDGELLSILEAVQTRIVAGEARFQWCITWGDLEVTEDNLLLDEAISVEEATGTTWASIDPARNARQCRAILRACLISRRGLTPTEADAELAKVGVTEIVGCLSRVEVNPAPLDSATSET